jgi:tetratricopeptide (TPR) repeat protein
MNANAENNDRSSGKTEGQSTATTSTELVILIHGTGAGRASDEGEQWWQRGSEFTRDLNSRLHPSAQCLADGPLFRWSGSNSENARRSSGRNLYEKYLLPLENAGRPYHLLGHSHGGGVIVHALVEAARKNHRLAYLRSWSTIGTPFLSFVARRWHRSGTLAILAALAGSVVLSPLAVEYGSHWSDLLRDRNFTAVIVPPILLTIPLTIGTIALLGWGISRLGQAQAARYASLSETIVSGYGGHWLGIAPGADEAINGLGSTLTLRSNIAWRLPSVRPKNRWLSVLLSPVRFVTWLYNTVVAEAADEFIWSLATRRLQGTDIRGQVMATVRRELRSKAFEVTPLDPVLERNIISQANAGSVGTLASIRSVLGLASQAPVSGRTLLAGFKEALTWQELVHTSYTRYPAIIDLLANHILANLTSARSGVVTPQSPVTHKPAVTAEDLPRLNLLVNIALAVLISLTTALAIVIGRALVDPYTAEFQVNSIWTELHDPEVLNPHGVSVGLASILAAHALLVRDGTDDAVASSINSLHTRHVAMEWVAEAHAMSNGFTNAKKLLQQFDDSAAGGHAAAIIYRQLASVGNCSTAAQFAPYAIQAAQTAQTPDLLIIVAGGLKTCHNDQEALDLVEEALKIAKSKSWEASELPSQIAGMNEEAETVTSVDELFKQSNEEAHQLVSAAAVFANAGNKDAARRLLSKVEASTVDRNDAFAMLKLSALLPDTKIFQNMISRYEFPCDGLAEIGMRFAANGSRKEEGEIEDLMLAEASALPLRSRVAECLLNLSLMKTASGQENDATLAFAQAVELIPQVPNGGGVRASLSSLAAEVALRSHRTAEVSRWLESTKSDANQLPPRDQFRTMMRLARVALAFGETKQLREILANAKEAIGRDTEYQSRSPMYRELAELYAEAGWYRDARLTAEKAALVEDRLQAYVVIIWYVRRNDVRLLGPLLGVAKSEDGEITLENRDPNEQKLADKDDDRQFLRLGFGPVCPVACTTGH